MIRWSKGHAAWLAGVFAVAAALAIGLLALAAASRLLQVMAQNDEEEPSTMADPKSGPASDWTKKVAVGISVLAFVATAASAAAAWQSWRTARATENIARSTLDLSGAKPLIDDNVEFSGDCNAGHRIEASVTVRNIGHIATTLTRLELSVEYTTLSGSPSQSGNGTWTSGGASGTWAPVTIAFERGMAKLVPPQDELHVTLPVNCLEIESITLPESAASDLVQLINGAEVAHPTVDGQRVAKISGAYLSAIFGSGDGPAKRIQHAEQR